MSPIGSNVCQILRQVVNKMVIGEKLQSYLDWESKLYEMAEFDIDFDSFSTIYENSDKIGQDLNLAGFGYKAVFRENYESILKEIMVYIES